MTLELEDLRNSYGAYYLALNQDYRWVDYQQNKIVPALEAVARGELKRVMFFLPPGFGKSDLGTRNFIPYWMGKHPAKNAMVLSYAASLATDDFGGKVKERLQSDLHQLLFPESKLSQDSHGKNQFRTINGGTFYSVGFGGAIAGKRVDLCFPAGTMVTTERGKIDIAKLAQMKSPPRVLSYNDKSKSLVWAKITASSWRETDALVEIETAGGRKFRCTRNHRIYTDDYGYREAERLQRGDRLQIANVSYVSQAVRKRAYVMPILRKNLSKVRPQVQGVVKKGAHGIFLLSNLCGSLALQGNYTRKSPMWILSNWLSRAQSAACILLENLRGKRPCYANAGEGQLQLQAWAKLREALPRDEDISFGTRQKSVCGMRKKISIARASYRSQPGEQSAAEFDYSLQAVSHDSPQVGRDTVAVVRRLRPERVAVYDLEVEGTHNFFADEVRVSNCLLDDLIKNDDEANSEIIQEKLFQTYGSVVKARLRPGGAIVFLMTRWRLRDIAGRILELEGRVENGGDWTVITLPAQNEDGSFLWDFYPKSHYEQAMKFEESWQSLWQQDPQGSKSLWFKRDWLEFYDVCPPRDKFNNYMIIDPAMGLGKKSDNTAIHVWAAGPEQRHILVDWVYDKLDPGERARTIIAMAKRWQPKQVIYEEIGLNSDTYFIRKMMKEENHPPRFYPIPVGRHGPRHLLSKELRIKELVPIFFDRKIILPRKFLYTNHEGRRIDLTERFIQSEYSVYKGKGSVQNDDDLDAMSRIREEELVWRHYEQVEKREERTGRTRLPATSWESVY